MVKYNNNNSKRFRGSDDGGHLHYGPRDKRNSKAERRSNTAGVGHTR